MKQISPLEFCPKVNSPRITDPKSRRHELKMRGKSDSKINFFHTEGGVYKGSAARGGGRGMHDYDIKNTLLGKGLEGYEPDTGKWD